MTKIIAISNQKGGVGKTTTTIALGASLAQLGKKVLLVDYDPQGSMTHALGIKEPDDLKDTITSLMNQEIDLQPTRIKETILEHKEGMDFIPSNVNLASMDMRLISTLSREKVLKSVLNRVRNKYDYIIIDCLPTLSLLNINALTAANEVIIPVQAEHLSIAGLHSLLSSVISVRRSLNKKLDVAGVIITMTDKRTNLSKVAEKTIREELGNTLYVFSEAIPRSVKVAESSVAGESVVQYDPKGNATKAYMNIAKEVIEHEERSISRSNEEYHDR